MRSTGVLAALLLATLFTASSLSAEGGDPAASGPADPHAAAAPELPPADAASEPSQHAEPAAQDAHPTPAEHAEAQPAESSTAPVTEAPAPTPVAKRHQVRTGPSGFDEQGHQGRVHFVERGDTLWDIAGVYLATPWVWPSIWKDNRNIANPHRIYPGDRIWITDGEMRVVSAEEAQQMIRREPPAAPAPEPLAETPAPEATAAPESRPLVYEVSSREISGYVTPEQLAASASVVEGFVPRQMYAQGDEVYVGLGEGQAQPADQFTAYRADEKVLDPEDGHLIGYHVELLGRLELVQVHAESATAIVRQGSSEIELGDRVMPHEPIPSEIAATAAPADLRARVAFFAKSRTQVAQEDYVILNRGSDHGIEVGSMLEVFRPGRRVPETVRGEDVMLPDRPLAELLVVRVQKGSATAIVLHAELEIEVGDPLRASTRMPLAAR